MALSATVVKAQLQLSDLDRHHYATHNLTVAQHPSESDLRLMARLLAFAWCGEDDLEFGRGVSTDDEPDIWSHSLIDEVKHWIDIGQPDPDRVRRAGHRADRVTVVGYQPRAFAVWWEKHGATLERQENLQVVELPLVEDDILPFYERNMQLDVLIQEGELHVTGDAGHIVLTPAIYKRLSSR